LTDYAYNAEDGTTPSDYCLGIDLEGGGVAVPGNDTECDAEEGTDTTGIAWTTATDPAGEYSVNP
jgi:hypothetical protein